MAKGVILLLVFAAFLIDRNLLADTAPKLPWGPHPDVASISATVQDHILVVSLKKVSKASIKIDCNVYRHLAVAYYIDNQGALQRLGEQPNIKNIRDFSGSGGMLTDIPPNGEVLQESLSDAELALIKIHPVTCRIHLADSATKQHYLLASEPQMVSVNDDKK